MSNSSVTNNNATLAAGFPSSVGVVYTQEPFTSLRTLSSDGHQHDDFGNAATMTNSVGDSSLSPPLFIPTSTFGEQAPRHAE
jgi:hypothetical protein